MALLDNSGDIVLDAVLTDAGRRALARGDGTFKISYFRLGDDEINYGLFNSEHTGGTPYYDLEILQTPTLEALTNNEASLNSPLLTYQDNNLLYLPQLILNTNIDKTYGQSVGFFQYEPAKNTFIVACTPGTEKAFGPTTIGVLWGANPAGPKSSRIRLEFGLNAEGKTPSLLKNEFPALYDDKFTIEFDERFCSIVNPSTGDSIPYTTPDENSIAAVSATPGSGLVMEMNQLGDSDDADQPDMKWSRGPKIEFKIRASDLLRQGDPGSSKSLWQKHGQADSGTDWNTTATTIGSSATCGATVSDENNLDNRAQNGDLWHINSNIRVTSNKTGASIDIPVRFYKSKNFKTSC